MSNENDNRLEQGLEKFEQLNAGMTERALQSLIDTHPDLARIILEFPYGEVYNRHSLDVKYREIAAIAAMVALGTTPVQLRTHIHGALNVGVTREEVVEVILQMAVYTGFPHAINGMHAAKKVFQERDRQGLAP